MSPGLHWRVLTLIAVACLPARARAAEPASAGPSGATPAAAEHSAAAAATGELSVVEVSAEELSSGAPPSTGGSTTPPSPIALALAADPESVELSRILEDGRARVAELVAQLDHAQGTARYEQLQRLAVRVKLDTRQQFLEAKSRFARARGDLATADAADRALDRLLHPPTPVVTPHSNARALRQPGMGANGSEARQ